MSTNSQPSAAETSSSPAFGFASADQLRCERVRVVEDRRVAGRLPAVGRRAEAQLLAVAARDRLVAFEPQRRLDRRLAVERARERRGVDARVGQQIHLAGAVRRGDDDAVGVRRERQLELRRTVDRRLAVIGVQDHRVAVEELVGAAGCVERAPGSQRRCARARRPRRPRARARATRSRSRRGSTRESRSRRA